MRASTSCRGSFRFRTKVFGSRVSRSLPSVAWAGPRFVAQDQCQGCETAPRGGGAVSRLYDEFGYSDCGASPAATNFRRYTAQRPSPLHGSTTVAVTQHNDFRRYTARRPSPLQGTPIFAVTPLHGSTTFAVARLIVCQLRLEASRVTVRRTVLHSDQPAKSTEKSKVFPGLRSGPIMVQFSVFPSLSIPVFDF